jgi:hypothetical protein
MNGHSRDGASTERSERRSGPDSQTSPQGSTPSSIDQDLSFELLMSARRRWLLRILSGDERQGWTADSLATAVTAREQDLAEDAVGDERRTDTQIAMYHTDLPKLANLGIVEYTRTDEGVVVEKQDADGTWRAIETALNTFDDMYAPNTHTETNHGRDTR